MAATRTQHTNGAHGVALALARLNRAAAWVAALLAGFALLLFAVGWFGGGPHQGLMGLLVGGYFLPFAPAFAVAARAWDRGWRFRALAQTLPLVVALAWRFVV